MKRSKRLSVSILVASVLLISEVKSANSESRNSSSAQHKRPAAEGPTNSQQRTQEPTDPISVFRAAQSTLNEALHVIRAQEETTEKHERPKKDNWDKAAVIADWLLFIVGCCYTYFAWRQWGAIDEQAQTAQKTLDAIKKQAEIADRALLVANRAYLYLSGVRISVYGPARETAGDEPVYKYVIVYPIYNGGQTPALYVGAFARTIVDSKAPQEVSPSALALDRTQNAVVPPRCGEPLNPPYDSFLSEKELADIQTRQYSLFFYGVLTYFDVFDEERHTWFALRYGGRIGNNMPMDFVATPGLNRFD